MVTTLTSPSSHSDHPHAVILPWWPPWPHHPPMVTTLTPLSSHGDHPLPAILPWWPPWPHHPPIVTTLILPWWPPWPHHPPMITTLPPPSSHGDHPHPTILLDGLTMDPAPCGSTKKPDPCWHYVDLRLQSIADNGRMVSSAPSARWNTRGHSHF